MKYILFSIYLFPFGLVAQDLNFSNTYDSIIHEEIDVLEQIDLLDKTASYPGGTDSLTAYFKRNNKWKVGQVTISGSVYVGFIIEKDGSISHVELVKGLEKSSNEEALRLIQNMPKWEPAEFKKKKVRMRIIIPIRFNGLN